MTDTNNTDGAALLPVTPEDTKRADDWATMIGRMGGVILDQSQRRGLASQFAAHRLEASGVATATKPATTIARDVLLVQAFADLEWLVEDNQANPDAIALATRHRISHSLPGDVGMLVEKLRKRVAQIPAKIAERENEAQSHCGAYGTDTAEDYMDDEDVLLMRDAADALAALSSPLPATQEDAERSGADVGHDAIKKIVYRAYCAGFNDRPGDQFWNDREAGFDAAIAALSTHAMSTPQRQEYDGEAVREALAHARDGLQRICARKCQVDASTLWADMVDDMDAFAQEVLDRSNIRALAHPAQATPSALSGDAGEGE